MENIYKVDERPWILNEPLKISHSLEGWRALGIEQQEQKLDQINDERKKLLDKKLDEFITKDDHHFSTMFTHGTASEKCLKIDPDCTLKTYTNQLEHAKRLLTDRAYKVRFLSSLKFTRQEILMRHLAAKPIKTLIEAAIQENRNKENSSGDSSTSTSEPPITTEEPVSGQLGESDITALLTVQIWAQPDKAFKPKLERELLVKSEQTLAELRPHFKCVRDFSIPMDLSDDPDTIDRVVNGELYKSGFFLIEDTFYNDMRQPTNIDLSTVIIDWASSSGRGIGPFYSKRMEETKFSDVIIRLGHPYLYQHQGDCEHLFVFSDVQFVKSSLLLDIDQKLKFPIVTGTMIGGSNIKCYMCHKRTPHWYTRFNERLPVDPFYFCEICFQSFNYDKEKQKIGNFKAYPYIDVSSIPESAIM